MATDRHSYRISGLAIETNDDRDERLHIDAFYRGVTFYCRMLKVGMS